MKILWLVPNTPTAVQKTEKNIVTAGWIDTLEHEISTSLEIELGVAYFSTTFQLKKVETRITEKLIYYEIPKCRYLKSLKRVNSQKNNVNFYLEIISHFKPDIIEVFGTESDFGLIIKKINIPVIIHIQGVLGVCYHSNEAIYSTFKKYDVLKQSSEIVKLDLFTYIKNYFRLLKSKRENKYLKNRIKTENIIYKECKYFSGRTDWDRRIVKLLANEAKYYHIDEILRPIFFKNYWNKSNLGTKLQFVSIIGPSPYKGLETVVEAATLLTNKNIKFIWKIIGIKNTDGIAQITQMKYKIKYDQISVSLLGKKNENDMITILLDSNIYIHPSHIENSCNSVCEAMLLGMPIIATYAGGTSSLIENNKEGLLIQDGDPYSMAGTIIDLISKPILAEKLGKKARLKAIKRHNSKQIIENTINAYKSILIKP